MKRFLITAVMLLGLACAGKAHAQLISGGGGGGGGGGTTITGGACTDPAYMQGISTSGVPTCNTPAGIATPVSVANGGTGQGTAPSTGQFLVASSGTAFAPTSMSSDCSLSAVTPGSITCTKSLGSTIASVGATNVFTNTNTFPATGLQIKGTGSGVTTLGTANAGATNFTATFPAATDTIAELGQTQTWTANQTFPNTGIIQRGTSTGNLTITNALAAAGSFNATFPANTGTVGELNLAQSWTAAQTFPASGIKLTGSSTGVTTFTSANASASNFTITVPAVTDTLAVIGQPQTWTGVQTFSSAPSMSGASITSATIPMASLVNSGVSAASYTNANITVNAQGLITTASNGAAASPMTTHTLTESAGAATMAVTSSSSANIESNYVALNAAITLTTPAAAGMADAQQIYVYATTSGSAWTYTTAAGSGVTLASVVPGDSSPYGKAAACGIIPATGAAWWHWQYRSSSTTLTLLECGVSPPSSANAFGLATTWTPVLSATTTPPTITMNNQTGYYWQFGKMYLWAMSLTWTANSGGAGNAIVTGFPLTANGGLGLISTCVGQGYTPTANTVLVAWQQPGQTQFQMLLGNNSTASTAVGNSVAITAFGSVGAINCSGWGFTN